jgi:hypothetical protein
MTKWSMQMLWEEVLPGVDRWEVRDDAEDWGVYGWAIKSQDQ